jgi:phytoene dehydrogenase-like protein
MKQYQYIVVGAGVSGMTLALLLARNGGNVLLLEQGAAVGGSIARFRRAGVGLDTGFHFTGGFGRGAILAQMLEVLGIADAIEPDPILRKEDSRFIIEASGNAYDLPVGYDAVRDAFAEYFPQAAEAVHRHFVRVRDIADATASMDLRTLTEVSTSVAEDHVPFAEELRAFADTPELQTILAGYSMCYGVPADEVSLANHCRVVCGLYASVARVKGGGDAFVRALHGKLEEHGVEILCGTPLAECRPGAGRRIGSFVLGNGEEVRAEHCIFTIHPRSILATLPPDSVSPAFVSRVKEFEPSNGFFCVYAEIAPESGIPPFDPAIVSLYASPDYRDLFDPSSSGRPVVVMRNRETDSSGRTRNIINAFEVSYPADVAAWGDSRTGRRPAAYQEYKERRTESICQRIFRHYPEYRKGFRLLDSASMLTFRDYLRTPFGCAYGIKQKIGQFSLFGRLPFRNVYAAGQSAALPGLVGAMLSSFILARSLVGREPYAKFIESGLEGGGAR